MVLCNLFIMKKESNQKKQQQQQLNKTPTVITDGKLEHSY